MAACSWENLREGQEESSASQAPEKGRWNLRIILAIPSLSSRLRSVQREPQSAFGLLASRVLRLLPEEQKGAAEIGSSNALFSCMDDLESQKLTRKAFLVPEILMESSE